MRMYSVRRGTISSSHSGSTKRFSAAESMDAAVPTGKGRSLPDCAPPFPGENLLVGLHLEVAAAQVVDRGVVAVHRVGRLRQLQAVSVARARLTVVDHRQRELVAGHAVDGGVALQRG